MKTKLVSCAMLLEAFIACSGPGQMTGGGQRDQLGGGSSPADPPAPPQPIGTADATAIGAPEAAVPQNGAATPPSASAGNGAFPYTIGEEAARAAPAESTGHESPPPDEQADYPQEIFSTFLTCSLEKREASQADVGCQVFSSKDDKRFDLTRSFVSYQWKAAPPPELNATVTPEIQAPGAVFDVIYRIATTDAETLGTLLENLNLAIAFDTKDGPVERPAPPKPQSGPNFLDREFPTACMASGSEYKIMNTFLMRQGETGMIGRTITYFDDAACSTSARVVRSVPELSPFHYLGDPATAGSIAVTYNAATNRLSFNILMEGDAAPKSVSFVAQ